MQCLYCGKRLSLLRKLAGREYCNDEHRSLFMQDQESLGLARLIDAKRASQNVRPRKRQTSPPGGIPAMADRFLPEPPRAISVVNPCFAPGSPIPGDLLTSYPQAEPKLGTAKLPERPRGILFEAPSVPEEPSVPEKMAAVAPLYPPPLLPEAPDAALFVPREPERQGFLLPSLDSVAEVGTPRLQAPEALAPALATTIAGLDHQPGVAVRTASDVALGWPAVAGDPPSIEPAPLEFGASAHLPVASHRIEALLAADPERLPEIENCVPTFVPPPLSALFLEGKLRVPEATGPVAPAPPCRFPVIGAERFGELRRAGLTTPDARPLAGDDSLLAPAAEAGSIHPAASLPRVMSPQLGGGLRRAGTSAVPVRPPESVTRVSTPVPEARAVSTSLAAPPELALDPVSTVPRFDHPLIGECPPPESLGASAAEPRPLPHRVPANALALPSAPVSDPRPARLGDLAGHQPIGFALPSGDAPPPADRWHPPEPLEFSAGDLAGHEMARLESAHELTGCHWFLPIGIEAPGEPRRDAVQLRREPLPPTPLPMEAAAIPREPVLEESATGDAMGERQPTLRDRPGLLPLTLHRTAPAALPSISSGRLEPVDPLLRPIMPKSGLEPVLRERSQVGNDKDRTAGARLWDRTLTSLSGYWRHVPSKAVWYLAALPILALLLTQIPLTKPMWSAPAGEVAAPSELKLRWQTFQANIVNRAAVSLADDFRGGLADWEGDGNWARSWSYDAAGFIRPGQLAFYKPSMALTDYRLQFTGQIERQGLSWVFRAEDAQNYHAGRLVITEPGPLPKGALVRYAVVDGRRGRPTRTDLPFRLRNEKMYQIRVDVRGASFTTYVDGRVVDFFKDDRLSRGGVGFFRGNGERSRLRWVGVTHQYDILGRLCALVAPHNLETASRSIHQ